jgi:protein ImuB
MIACVRVPRSVPEGALVALVQDFSPRFEIVRADVAIVDVSGLERLVGTAREIGEAIRRLAEARGVASVVAIAHTRTAALLLAVGSRRRLTIVEPGTEEVRVAPLPLGVLAELARVECSEPPSRTNPIPSRQRSHRRYARGGGRHYRLAPVPDQAGAAATAISSPATLGREAIDAVLDDLLQTLSRWGLSTLGDFACLDSVELFERLGSSGVAWQAVARGRDIRPLVRTRIEEPYEASITLEWPIDALEPLSFVLGRLLDPLSARLERESAGAAAIQVTLQLVSRAVHVRSLALPTPIRDPRVLRTLALLDLESHPPDAAIDRVTVTIGAVPGRIVQYSLLTRAAPVPEQMATLTARVSAVMGEGRVGTPVLVDSHRPGAFGLHGFTGHLCSDATMPLEAHAVEPIERAVPPAVRRFRDPLPAHVATQNGRPARVALTHHVLSGGAVVQAAGPWRTSGEWWTRHDQHPWDRDEWDVVVRSGAVLRLFRDRVSGNWFVDAVLD